MGLSFLPAALARRRFGVRGGGGIDGSLRERIERCAGRVAGDGNVQGGSARQDSRLDRKRFFASLFSNKRDKNPARKGRRAISDAGVQAKTVKYGYDTYPVDTQSGNGSARATLNVMRTNAVEENGLGIFINDEREPIAMGNPSFPYLPSVGIVFPFHFSGAKGRMAKIGQ